MAGNKSSDKQFLGVFFTLFAFFLLWGGYKAFEKNPNLFGNQPAILGFAGGTIFLIIAYFAFLRD